MKKVKLAAIAIVLFAKMQAQLQENPIDEVTVQGKFLQIPYKKVAENITIISKEEIANAPAKSIEEVLAQFTGLDIRRRGGNGVQADISVRGGSFEQVLILINGIRMNDSQTGHNSMNIPVDMASIERIEVIKGPAARKFGNNAYAGVINIVTKVDETKNIRISAEGGDYKSYKVGAASNFGTEKWQHFLQANMDASDGYRYNTDYKIQNVFYQNLYKITNGNLQLQAGFQEKKFGANGFYASPLAKDQYEETQASVVSLAHRQKFGKFGINSAIFWRRGQDMYLYNRNKPEIYRNMHIGNNVGAEFNTSYASNLGVSGIGVELRKEFLTSNNLGKRERFVSQVFAEHHFKFFDQKLQITPGISWANFSNAGSFFYPGIDIGFTEDDFKIYFNWAKVHRIPTYTDLYYVSGTEQGNTDLKPENAISTEGGFVYAKNKMNFKMSAFFRNTNDGIDWVKNTAVEKWTAQNIGKIETKGFELEANLSPAKWISLGFGYTYINNDFVKTAKYSRYAAENLKHQLVAKLGNKFLGFSNELIYRYNERVSTGSYLLLDDKISYDFKKLQLYFLVNNLTNTDYTEAFGVPMPKRWFHAGFTYRFGL